MLDSFNEINFMGIMGNNKFNVHGETGGMMNIEQFIGYKIIIFNIYIYIY